MSSNRGSSAQCCDAGFEKRWFEIELSGCTKFNFCRVSSYSYVCIRRLINRDKYIITFILYIKISWVQGTHCLCHGKFWFLVVSNFDQRQNSEVNTCIRGVVSFSKESQSEICAWIVRNEFKSSGNDCCCSLSLSLFCLYRVSRVCAWSSSLARVFHRLFCLSSILQTTNCLRKVYQGWIICFFK